jgi:hypothetical protein
MMNNHNKVEHNINAEKEVKLTVASSNPKKKEWKRYIMQLAVVIAEVLILWFIARSFHFNHSWTDFMVLFSFFIVLMFSNELYKEVSTPSLDEALIEGFNEYKIEEQTKDVVRRIKEQNKSITSMQTKL